MDALTRFLNLVQRSGAQVVSIWPRTDNLEDLFLREVRGPGPEADA